MQRNEREIEDPSAAHYAYALLKDATLEPISVAEVFSGATAGSQCCSLCGKAVSTKHGMVRHLKIVHQGAEESKCDMCGRMFSTKFALQRHIKKVHEGISEFVLPCPCCGKKFSAKHGLERHMRLVHESAELSVCPLCGRTFSTKFALNRHTKTVHANTLSICAPCGVVFTSKFALLGHNLTVHNTSKVFACFECPKCFPDAEGRQAHKDAEHNDSASCSVTVPSVATPTSSS